MMSPLTTFGLLSVILMLIFYMLEERNPWFIFCFAVSCAMGSVYGFLQGAWPFGVIEIVWTIVVLRKWWLAKTRGA